jgi:hypothetical protein
MTKTTEQQRQEAYDRNDKAEVARLNAVMFMTARKERTISEIFADAKKKARK